jgi:hypothetical protein
VDPEANLQEQLSLSKRIIEKRDRELLVDESEVERLAELVVALDDWITRGGFLPQPWHDAVVGRVLG